MCVCMCEMDVNVCVCGPTQLNFHTLVDGPAVRAFHKSGGEEKKKKASDVCLHSLSFSPSKKKKVPPVIPAICLISCHTCLMFFQGKTRQKERGEGVARREGGNAGRPQLRGGRFVWSI